MSSDGYRGLSTGLVGFGALALSFAVCWLAAELLTPGTVSLERFALLALFCSIVVVAFVAFVTLCRVARHHVDRACPMDIDRAWSIVPLASWLTVAIFGSHEAGFSGFVAAATVFALPFIAWLAIWAMGMRLVRRRRPVKPD